MRVLYALLRSQAATALDRQNVLDLILHDQVSLHQLDAEIQANLTDDEFEADILNAIDYDERICALRTRVRFSASQDLFASPVPQPRAALFSSCIATSTLCSPPEEARPTVSTKVTGHMPPARAMTVARVEKHDDKEGAARYNDAKEDPEGLSPRERLLRPPYPGVSVIAFMEKSRGPCQDLAVTYETILSDTSDRPCCSAGVADTALTSETSPRPFRNHDIANLTTGLETTDRPCSELGVIDATPILESSMPHCGDPRIGDLSTALETSDPFCHGPGVDDATLVLESSELPCCDPHVGDTSLVSQEIQQPRFESNIFLLGPATKTRFVQKMDSLQGVTKRMLLRRSVCELRRRKRTSAALMPARWGGILEAKQNKCLYGDDPFFRKRNSIVYEPLYRVESTESEILWFAKKTDTQMEHTYFFMEEVSDVVVTAMPYHSPDAHRKFDHPHQLFPFDPGGCLLVENLEHGFSSRVTIGTFAIFTFRP